MLTQSNRTEQRTSGAAFTLIELLVVLSIISVVVMIAVPTVASVASPKHALRKEARRLMSLMQEARVAAMTRKLRVDIMVDPVLNEVRAVESAAYRRALSAQEPEGEAAREAWTAAISDRFERVLVLDDETMVEGFSVDQIDLPRDTEDPFLPVDDMPLESTSLEDQPEGPVRVVSFTHFGGSDGGGVSLARDAVRLDIAADILTGRPKLVRRKPVDPELLP